ncbi:hypothetical protein MACK_000993 [Theileria orientalis]|uniref:RRM domain-containing protein n=1 Tax=Theileria orientalis TaxID=68886 RepID=A0A976QUG0_THEOR|nr:hypothetical protein MACK_000993 [Theileria orientalis]
MRPRTTRSGPERPFTPRQNYSRRDEGDIRGVRYNSPSRYRDYTYGSARDPKDNYNARDFNQRDFVQGRDMNHRDYPNHREVHRSYPNSKDFNNPRDYTNSRDFPSNSRDYNNSRDFHPPNWDYHSNGREFHGPRDFHSSREFHNSRDFNPGREYPTPSSRDFNRFRDYNSHPPRNYPQSSRNVAEYDKFPTERRMYRERPGPYDRRAPPPRLPPVRRTEIQGYELDTRRTGPVRRTTAPASRFHKTKVFIGNLSGEVSQDELTSKFSTFGPINRIDFRRKFAFVDFVRSKDAEAAIREMHNKLIWGSWLKVQPHIEQQKKLSTREPKPGYQITVTNLDQSVSWQDLKDFARQAGEVNYASIIIKGNKRFGLIEFTNDESVQNALKDLNGKKIVSNKLELIHVPVSEFLKNLGYNNETLLVEEPTDDLYSNDSSVNHDSHNENDRYNNDTFEAEDNSRSPSPNRQSVRNGLYQEGNIETVDYN